MVHVASFSVSTSSRSGQGREARPATAARSSTCKQQVGKVGRGCPFERCNAVYIFVIEQQHVPKCQGCQALFASVQY